MGGKGQEYWNYRTIPINSKVQKVCVKAGIGLVDLWLSYMGKHYFFTKDGLRLSGKGAALTSGYLDLVQRLEFGVDHLQKNAVYQIE